MRNEIGEPTGMHIRTEAGVEETMEFTAFVAAIERGDIRPEAEVRSHIVTQDRWVRVREMRMYREIRRDEGGAEKEGGMEKEGGETPPLPYDA